MLRFLVGTAVRTAARSAGRAIADSHRENQLRAQQRAATPWTLTPCAPVGETGVYHDPRVGFAHALPGFPQLMAPPAAPNEPAIDGLVALSDAPIWLRYRLDRPNVQASSAMDAAMQLAQLYATNRTGAAQAIQPARPDRMQSHMVEAEASARYPLRQPDPFGADMEELTVLLRDGAAIAVTIRYPSAGLDWVHKAMFDAVSSATMLWRPGAAPYAPVVWPESSFLEPGLLTALKPHRQMLLSQIAPTLAALTMPEKEALSAALGALVQREEPPWYPLPPEALGALAHQLMSVTANPAAQAIFHLAVSEVRTAHDARGLAVWLGRGMS